MVMETSTADPHCADFDSMAPRLEKVDCAVSVTQLEVQGDCIKTASGPEHLVVFVHGVYGTNENFDFLREQLRKHEEFRRALFHSSAVNRRTASFSGIDRCGKRLVDDVRAVVCAHPSLERISFVVYSMGGLFARYACGLSFDPKTKTLFGLAPCHFFAIASPHLGCCVQGESQVPFIGWGLNFPYGGWLLRPIFDFFAAPVTEIMYRISGRHLFLADGENTLEPMVLKLVHDRPGEGMFLSALAHFKSRVCCSNVWGDALVGWANSSLRKEEELPREKERDFTGLGVMHEDSLASALWEGKELSEWEARNENSALQDDLFASIKKLKSLEGIDAVLDYRDRQATVAYMLGKLQALPWCRIDVAFSATIMAHTHIIVAKGKRIDGPGIPVVEHIASRLAMLEHIV